MAIKQDLEERLKIAQKSGDTFVVSTIRFLLSSVKNGEIDNKREATDDDVLTVVRKQVKERRESIESFDKYGRTDLATKERKEMEYLSKLLPPQMTEDQIRKIITEEVASLAENDRKNMGLIMRVVMTRIGNSAEGGMVAKLVKELL